MKKTKELQELCMFRLLHTAVLTIAFMLCLLLSWGCFSIVSHAESAGKVTASGGAKVRSSASTSASQITSYEQGAVISIRSQVQGSDGYTWYEVWTDAETRGYVRSDLVTITDGSTPPTSEQAPASSSKPSTNNQAQAEVSRVNPISATVANGGASGDVRIRSNASTNSQIVTTVKNGLALTVNGQANSLDRDGKVWYQVNFISDGEEVSGFIREDYVSLSGELTPYTEPETDPGIDTEPEPSPESPTQPETSKECYTYEQDGKWYVHTPSNETYDLQALLELNEYVPTLSDLEKKVKSQKIVIVILIFLLIAAAGAVGFLVYKIKDMMDSAYFNSVENETLRRRGTQSGQGGRLMQNVGADKKGTPQRPQGQRPSGAPQGQRPSGAPQGQRPSGAPQGQRPSGAPQGQRPSGAPQGQRPSGAPQGQRPSGAPQGQRPSGAPQGQRPSGAPQGQRPSGAPQSQGSARPQPKNFMTEEDEFEFEFLNYDGENNK